MMEGRRGGEAEQRREKHGGSVINRRVEEKGKWDVKISGHVFVTNGPISCSATSARRSNVGTHTHAHVKACGDIHPSLAHFFHKQKLFIVLLRAQRQNQSILTSFL